MDTQEEIKETSFGTLPVKETPAERKSRQLLLKTMVVICTKYNKKFLQDISRQAWCSILSYYLKITKDNIFLLCFHELLFLGIEMETESIVLNIALYYNTIGNLWEIIQARETDMEIFKGQPHNEIHYNIANKIILWLEAIEGNPNYPIMNSQLKINLAWKKIKEAQNRFRETGIKNSANKVILKIKQKQDTRENVSSTKGTVRVTEKKKPIVEISKSVKKRK